MTEPVNSDDLKPLKEHTDEALIEELEGRNFHVYDVDMENIVTREKKVVGQTKRGADKKVYHYKTKQKDLIIQ